MGRSLPNGSALETGEVGQREPVNSLLQIGHPCVGTITPDNIGAS
jgi:hypothetical protein